jgi:hypothetical protein
LITVIGIIVGVVIVVFQLGRQHRNELKLQKENIRDQLRINLYQDFLKLLAAAVEKHVSSHMYAFSMPMHVQIYHDQISKGFPTSPLSYRAMEFSNRHHATLNAVIELVFLIERYYIVDPRLDIFKTAISVAHHDMLKTFSPLFTFLLDILPAELPLPNGSCNLVNVINTSDEQVCELKRLMKEYISASDDMGSYLHDLNVEIQNTLLSNIFPNKAPHRVPLDPKLKVISTDPIESKKLMKYFKEETDWGKEYKETIQNVQKELGNN